VPVADDPASVVTVLFMPVGLAVPTAILEVAVESLAPAPHFSSQLPIWVGVGEETVSSAYRVTLGVGT
jgi:hypothetical protein